MFMMESPLFDKFSRGSEEGALGNTDGRQLRAVGIHRISAMQIVLLVVTSNMNQ
jgi:hypothetical protein